MYYIFFVLFLLSNSFCYSRVIENNKVVFQERAFKQVPLVLQKAVNTLSHFPDSHQFIQHCEKRGGITLAWAPLGKDMCDACWIGEKRAIILNSSKQWTLGKQISSIIFELHNAASDEHFIQLNKLAYEGKITKDEYVESVEKQEYLNSLETQQLITKGIKLGYFPKDTFLPIYKSFEEHFKWQIALGHSDLIAQQYEEMRIEAERTI
ncbi:MAG: hypothetical protein P4L16_03680 [Chlamydiales bacterium]|nr:hypothetical protein [Chlamydiales bacterium]